MLSVFLESQLKTMALAGGVAASEGIPVHMGRRPGDGRGRAHPLYRMDPIELQHADHISLVLPLTLEHEIDERSPLYGHTYDSLSVSRLACMLVMHLPHTHNSSSESCMQPGS